jgi:hypothetical protein
MPTLFRYYYCGRIPAHAPQEHRSAVVRPTRVDVEEPQHGCAVANCCAASAGRFSLRLRHPSFFLRRDWPSPAYRSNSTCAHAERLLTPPRPHAEAFDQKTVLHAMRQGEATMPHSRPAPSARELTAIDYGGSFVMTPGLPWYYEITTSTRRFCRRPAEEVLGAIGDASP